MNKETLTQGINEPAIKLTTNPGSEPMGSDPTRSQAHTKKPQRFRARAFLYMAEREGFEPSVRCRTHTFQACSFDHSDTSPQETDGLCFKRAQLYTKALWDAILVGPILKKIRHLQLWCAALWYLWSSHINEAHNFFIDL